MRVYVRVRACCYAVHLFVACLKGVVESPNVDVRKSFSVTRSLFTIQRADQRYAPPPALKSSYVRCCVCFCTCVRG